MTQIPSRIWGDGVVLIHSRRCEERGGGSCCSGSYQAWYWDQGRGKKVRKGRFATRAEARMWRLNQLRRLYAAAPKDGRADRAYTLLRKCSQELDAARLSMGSRGRVAASQALSALYEAEDALLACLREI